MRRAMWSFALILAVGVALSVAGCSGVEDLIAYTGGGLPPGEPDLGGIVVAQVPDSGATSASVVTAQIMPPEGTVAVADAQIVLMRRGSVVGRARSGEGGYFRFEAPDTGSYRVLVIPPGDSGLRAAEQVVAHQRGRMTFITVILEREE